MSMFLLRHQCMWPECETPVIGDLTCCSSCARVLCAQHHKPPNHTCLELQNARKAARLSAEAYWTPLIPKLHNLDLAQQASQLRPGHRCTARLPSTWEEARPMGLHSLLNSHFFIDFDDGVQWLVRIRKRKPWSPPVDIQLRIDESEVATMEHLKQAGLPVPGVWRPAEAEKVAKNEGIFYFFIEYYHGKQLPARASPLVPAHLSQSHLEQLILEYAKFQIKLSSLTYGAIGCVLPSSDGGETKRVGPFPNFCRPDPPTLLGPYKTQRDRYCEQIGVILKCIAVGGLFVERKEFATLAFIHAKGIVCEMPAMKEEEREFFIKHPDDKGDVFFCSPDGNGLEGIIDWEWAFTTTASEAFSSPHFCYSSPTYRKGNNELSPEEELLVRAYESLGRRDLAQHVRNGRMHNRLRDLLRGVVTVGGLNGLSLAAGLCEPDSLPGNRSEWVMWAKTQYQDEEGVVALVL